MRKTNGKNNGRIRNDGRLGLDEDEQKELDELRKQREEDIKQKRLSVFKALPQSLRQKIVDEILIGRAINEMHETNVDKSERQVELECAGLPHNYLVITDPWGMSFPRRYSDVLKWFTEDEIINAHNDACAEEVLLGD